MSIQDVKTLSNKELDKLISEVKFEKDIRKGVPLQEEDPAHQRFYETVTKALKEAIGTPIIPYSYFKERDPETHKQLIFATEFIDEFTRYALNIKELSIRDQLRSHILFTSLMITNQREHHDPKFPLSIMSLIYRHKDFPALVDQAFPGYIDGGIGKAIFSEPQDIRYLKFLNLLD